SSGVATVSAITFGLAPGYTVRTTTDGGTTSGYSPIGSSGIEIRPAAKITIDSTAAKIGRSMKNLEKSMVCSLRGHPARGVGNGAPVPARGGAGVLLRRPWPIRPARGEGRGGSAASAPRPALPDEGGASSPRGRAFAPALPRLAALGYFIATACPGAGASSPMAMVL